MSPLTPHWQSPSYPKIQQVIVTNPDPSNSDYSTISRSLVALPPFALFAPLTFPPCTLVPTPSYATVQIARDRHLHLNSDLLYINHSCAPSLIFDTAGLAVVVGPRGLAVGDELTFFYPSTEWRMAQPFRCHCGAGHGVCRGWIDGAEGMPSEKLEGLWLNRHIRDLLAERDAAGAAAGTAENGNGAAEDDVTLKTLRDLAFQAEGVVDATRGRTAAASSASNEAKGDGERDGVRRGPTSRELSGEMGGDTATAI